LPQRSLAPAFCCCIRVTGRASRGMFSPVDWRRLESTTLPSICADLAKAAARVKCGHARSHPRARDGLTTLIQRGIIWFPNRESTETPSVWGGAGVLGVDMAVLTAHRHSTEVKSLVLLSGETFLPGQQFLRQASQLPGLFVAADDDENPPTEEVMEWIYGLSSNPGKRLVHYAGKKAPWNGFEDTGIPAAGTHGTDLFKTHPELPGIIVDWFVTTLIATPGHAPAEPLACASILNQLELPGGVAQVTKQLEEARRRDPKAQLFPEVVVTILGYDHLAVGETKLAVEIMRLVVTAYTDSADAYDSLSDAYLADGQKDSARQTAEKALALLDSHTAPESSWSDTEARRKLIRDGAQDNLKQLGTTR